ncbi:hypothetical protein N7501_005145 [Penicillium viridicatum]|nr:hypothetical protein N7501_005145 [Penicillium viridicatum]
MALASTDREHPRRKGQNEEWPPREVAWAAITKSTPVPVTGIGSRHLFSAFVSFDAFFRGADNVACIRIKADLVENLKTKLLIGMDVMGHEGFCLDFDAKTIKIPISIHSKPPHAAQRAVYAAEHMVIPPRSVVRVVTMMRVMPSWLVGGRGTTTT